MGERLPLSVHLCLWYNRLFRFRARFDWLIQERMAAESRWNNDPLQEGLRYAELEYAKAREFLTRLGNPSLAGKRILDFGCRFGGSTLWYADQGAAQVIGVDIFPDILATARKYVATRTGAGGAIRTEFRLGTSRDIPLATESADLIVTEDTVEHLEDPAAIFEEWWRVLVPGGKVLISFGPLWYHPHGLHFWEYFPAPWTHVLFSERALLRAKSFLKGSQGPGTWWSEFALNRMSLARFRRLLRGSRFQVLASQAHAVWGLKPILYLPGLREFFVSQVTCVLHKEPAV